MINDGLQKTDFGIDSFLMIGQSNIAARGYLAAYEELAKL